jgi:hypothetical protein
MFNPTRILAVIAAAALLSSGAQATADTTTFAWFRTIGTRTSTPKIVSLRNLDTLKTTSVTTKTPIYGPLLDKKGMVIGTKIVGYNSTTVKSTVVTPKSQIYSTSGSSTAFATPIVDFDFLVPVSGPFQSLLKGAQKAYFSLNAFSTEAPRKMVHGSTTIYSQAFGPGMISFTRTAPIQLYTQNGKLNGPARSNLLTVTFDVAKLETFGSTTMFSLIGSTPNQNLVYKSDFLGFDNATDFDFSLTMTAASPGLTLAAINPALTNVTGARSLNTTRATVTGGFAANSVPEPQSWALMMLGMGMVGAALRRRAVAVA